MVVFVECSFLEGGGREIVPTNSKSESIFSDVLDARWGEGTMYNIIKVENLTAVI